MSNRTLFLTDELYGCMRSVSLREPEILRRLREETSHDPMAGMQISPEQGQFTLLLQKFLPKYSLCPLIQVAEMFFIDGS